MASYSAKASVISRGAGRQAVAAAAYRSGEKLADDRQGLEWDFTKKRGVLHSEIVAPENAPAWAFDRNQLWNAAERRESGHAKQDSAATAREFRLALPHELNAAARLELTRRFAQCLVDRYGVAVDFSLHEADRHGDARNFHAHLMFTTRVMTAEGLTTKTRILDDLKKGPKEITALRQLWAEFGAEKLAEAGFVVEAERYRHGYKTLAEQMAAALSRGDHADAGALNREATIHLGPNASAMERKGEATELGDLNREIAARNAERGELREQSQQISAQIVDLDAERAKRQGAKELRAEAKTLDPERILASLTTGKATFTRADLNRALQEPLPDPKTRAAFTDAVLSREGVIPLREGADGPVSRYTTRAVLDSERQVTAAAEHMAKPDRHGVSAAGIAAALDHCPQLDKEQRDALAWATRANGFAVIAGEAGTGKSTTFAAIREAYAADGFRVLGLSTKNDVVQDMRRDGFDQVSTIAAELMRQASGRNKWNSRTVLMVDEAGMISTTDFAALMTKADAAGAKVILAGDRPQLGSIERGGMFGVLERLHGAAYLRVIRRVVDLAEKGAWNAMHRGDFRAALETFDQRGAIHWQKTPEESRAALVTKWADDTAADPSKARFVFAYTNAEVRGLNADLRAIRRERGELGEDHVLKAKEEEVAFATGDRIQFTGNAATQARKDAGLYNGAAGVVHEIDGARITVQLDGAKGDKPRTVSFTVGPDARAGEFDAIRHGYAGTIYKGQGKTLDQTYLLHSDQWRSASSYVALSRHRDSVSLFAAEKAAPWVMAEGGVAGLDDQQRVRAEQSFAAWKDAKPELAAKYGLADYVAYVQTQWADQKRFDPLDRLARQMGRSEEKRAAMSYIRADQPTRPESETRGGAGRTERKPPLSIVAAIVNNYIELCYDPAKDWLRWIAEDLKHRAASRRELSATPEIGNDAPPKTATSLHRPDERIRPDALPAMPSGVDAQRSRRKDTNGLPAGPGAGVSKDDGLQPLRGTDAVERQTTDERIRAKLESAERAAEREVTRRDEEDGPRRISDYLRGRGRFRDRGRDR